MQLINHVRKFTRLSSLLSTALLLASAFVSSQVYAAGADYISNSTTSVFTSKATWRNPASGAACGNATGGTWAAAGALTSADSVFICSGTTVTLATPASIGTVNLLGGTLALGVNDLTVSIDVISNSASSSVTSSGGSLVLTDADHTVSLWNGSGSATIPKLTLPSPATATRTITFADGVTITALSAIPTTSAGKGLIFACGTGLSRTIAFPSGTTIAYCQFPTTGSCTFTGLTCTNPPNAVTPPAVSAPIFSLKDKPAIFSEEVK